MKKVVKSRFGGVPHLKNIPPVETVGELREFLENLPANLPLAIHDEGYKPVWFNVGQSSEHLSLEPNDGTWDSHGKGA